MASAAQGLSNNRNGNKDPKSITFSFREGALDKQTSSVSNDSVDNDQKEASLEGM
jgi:hypothetical protein